MNLTVYEAECKERHRQEYLMPRAEQRAARERELSLLPKARQPKPRWSPLRLLGALMLRLGERLGGEGHTGPAGAS
jgi:hypothetical protein